MQSFDATAVTYFSLGHVSGHIVFAAQWHQGSCCSLVLGRRFFSGWPGKITTSPSTLVAHNRFSFDACTAPAHIKHIPRQNVMVWTTTDTTIMK